MLIDSVIKDEFSQIKGKALLTLTKVHIANENVDEAEVQVSAAKRHILELFGEEHPLSAKFNNIVMEVLQCGP